MNIFMPFIYISILATGVLFLISHWGECRGYYKKGNFWFDDIMHFCAGFIAAVFWSGLTSYWPLIISLTLIVGALWEIIEYLRGISDTRDSIEDLVCDLLGAAAWILILANF